MMSRVELIWRCLGFEAEYLLRYLDDPLIHLTTTIKNMILTPTNTPSTKQWM